MNYANEDQVCYRTVKIEVFFRKQNKRLNNAESSYSQIRSSHRFMKVRFKRFPGCKVSTQSSTFLF